VTPPSKMDAKRGRIASVINVGDVDFVPEAELAMSFADVDLTTPENEYNAAMLNMLSQLDEKGHQSPVKATEQPKPTVRKVAMDEETEEKDELVEKKKKNTKKLKTIKKKKKSIKSKSRSDLQGLANLDDEEEELVGMEDDGLGESESDKQIEPVLFKPIKLDTAAERARNVPQLAWKWFKFDKLPTLNKGPFIFGFEFGLLPNTHHAFFFFIRYGHFSCYVMECDV